MKNDAIFREAYKGYGIEIHQDCSPDSPRNWDNVGILCTSHRQYDLENETKINFSDFSSWGEIRDELVKTHKAIPALIFPLFMLDHSTQHIRFNRDFSDCGDYGRWDSGQIGYIYTTRERLIASLGYPPNFRLTNARIMDIQNILEQEIQTWDDYGNGLVYGFIIRNPEGQDVDSCWGYIGDWEADCLADAKSSVDSHLKNRVNAHVAKLKTLILNRVPLAMRGELLAQAVAKA